MWAAAEAIIGWLVVLNSLLPVVAVLRRRKLRELVMYQLVASMSLGETMTGIISIVLGTLQTLEVTLPSWICVVAVHFRSSVAASTVVCFLCLSLERYITVVHGLRYYDILTDGRRRMMVAASWMFAAVYFAYGQVLRFTQGIGPWESMCSHWKAVTFEFRFSGALFCTIAYLVNLGMNVFVGFIGIRQGRRIRKQQVGATRKGCCQSLLQHKGYMAIAILSLMCCIFIFPNTLMNMLQSLGVTRMELVHKVTTALRLISMITDGWCLALLFPKLRNEYKTIFCCYTGHEATLKSGAVNIYAISAIERHATHVEDWANDRSRAELPGRQASSPATPSANIPGIHKQSTRTANLGGPVTSAPGETKHHVVSVDSTIDRSVPAQPPSPAIVPPRLARLGGRGSFTWSRHVYLQMHSTGDQLVCHASHNAMNSSAAKGRTPYGKSYNVD